LIAHVFLIDNGIERLMGFPQFKPMCHLLIVILDERHIVYVSHGNVDSSYICTLKKDIRFTLSF